MKAILACCVAMGVVLSDDVSMAQQTREADTDVPAVGAVQDDAAAPAGIETRDQNGSDSAGIPNGAGNAVGDVSRPKGAKDSAHKPRITVSKETTFLTEPLRPDGYVDYLRALNERAAEGVTHANNAAVPLIKAFGPDFLDETIRERYLERLGLADLPEEGHYLVDFDDFLDAQRAAEGHGESSGLPEDRDQADELFKQALSKPWTSEQHPWMAKWLETNKRALELAEEASRRPRAYFPILTADDDAMLLGIPLSHSLKVREMARVLAARAMLRAGEGKPMAAWEDLLAIRRMARLIARGPTIIERLVGIGLEGMATQASRTLIQQNELAVKQCRQMQSDLAALEPMPPMVEVIDLSERLMYLDSVGAVARGGSKVLFSLNVGSDSDKGSSVFERMSEGMLKATVDWDIPMRMGNAWYDRIVAAWKIEDLAERQAALDQFDNDLRKLAQHAKDWKAHLARLVAEGPGAASGKMLGNFFVATLMPALSAGHKAELIGEAHARLLEIVVALEYHQRQQGSYPQSLDALMPMYLERVPLDPQSGKPFVYRPGGESQKSKGYVLYGMGHNGRDDGGRNRDTPGGDMEDWDDVIYSHVE